jgi:hypothetical protein
VVLRRPKVFPRAVALLAGDPDATFAHTPLVWWGVGSIPTPRPRPRSCGQEFPIQVPRCARRPVGSFPATPFIARRRQRSAEQPDGSRRALEVARSHRTPAL